MNKKVLFNNHNDWIIDTYKATNRKTGVVLWTSNGAWYFDGYNGTIKFGLIERHFLWRHFCNMLTRKVLGYDK